MAPVPDIAYDTVGISGSEEIVDASVAYPAWCGCGKSY